MTRPGEGEARASAKRKRDSAQPKAEGPSQD